MVITPWSVVIVVTPLEAWLRVAVKVYCAVGPSSCTEPLRVTVETVGVSTTVEVAEPLPSLTCSFSKPGPLTSVIVAVSALPSL
ncbi:hypothetical protein D3C77_672620 [compost metagenome]